MNHKASNPRSPEHISHFRSALLDWACEPNRDESYFTYFRNGTLSSLSPPQAFSAIDEAVSLLLEQDNSYLRYQCGLLVFVLARQAATTELSPLFEREWHRIIQSVSHDEWLANELCRWYRRGK
ncbi:MAG: hypothetical protein WKF55_01370 [Gemmatimonadaceae bacterium]